MNKEIYSVNRIKSLIKRFFKFENIISKPKFALVRTFDDNGLTAAQCINNISNSTIEFFLFTWPKDEVNMAEQFAFHDAHERIHRFVWGVCGLHDFKGEEQAIRKMCQYTFENFHYADEVKINVKKIRKNKNI